MALTSPSDPAGSFLLLLLLYFFSFGVFSALLFRKATRHRPPPPAPQRARRPPDPAEPGEQGKATGRGGFTCCIRTGFGARPAPAENGGSGAGSPRFSPGRLQGQQSPFPVRGRGLRGSPALRSSRRKNHPGQTLASKVSPDFVSLTSI